MMKVFNEIQRISQWYIWIFPIFVFIYWLYAFIIQVVFKIDVGTKPVSNIEMIILGFIPIGILVLFHQIILTTTIDEKTLKISLFPFCSREIILDEISKIELVKYDFVGFGCRFGTKYGIVYNIKGNKGFYIKTKFDEYFLVGSQKIDELKSHLIGCSINYNDKI
jgi:hypothetical protein